MDRVAAAACGALGVMLAACQPQAPITHADCFGDVAYAVEGWKSAAELGIEGSGVVYAMITASEVVLTASPPGPDGAYRVVLGRGLCYVSGGDADRVMKRAFGPTITVDRTVPP